MDASNKLQLPSLLPVAENDVELAVQNFLKKYFLPEVKLKGY